MGFTLSCKNCSGPPGSLHIQFRVVTEATVEILVSDRATPLSTLPYYQEAAIVRLVEDPTLVPEEDYRCLFCGERATVKCDGPCPHDEIT